MFKKQNIFVWLLGVIVGLSTPVFSQLALPHGLDFESTEGFVEGAFTQVPGEWESEGVVSITGLFSVSGQQSTEVGEFQDEVNSAVWGSFVSNVGSTIFVDFYVMPVVSLALPEELPWSSAIQATFLQLDETSAELYVTAGDEWDGGFWEATGVVIPVVDGKSQNFYRLTFRLDYEHHVADVFWENEALVFDLAFLDQGLSSFSLFKISDDIGGTIFDLFYSGYDNPLFFDEDGDGMKPDDEVTLGLDPSVNDRYTDSDLDGLFGFEEYILGTLADDADTDGDGVPDGTEVYLNEDPTLPDPYDLVVLPFADGFEGYELGELSSDNWGKWSFETGMNGTPPLVMESIAISGERSLILEINEEQSSLINNIDGRSQSTVWVDFLLKATPMEYFPSLEQTSTVGLFFDPEGVLHVYDGPYPAGEWVSLDDYATDLSLPNRITTHLNYDEQTYSLWLNGVLRLGDIHFANNSRYLNMFKLTNFGGASSVLDDVRVSVTEPPMLDNDGDGVVNSLEDLNGNGVLDEGETDPNQVDTDGDGIPDNDSLRLRLWLQASSGVQLDASGKVTAWLDQSGYGNDATQADPLLQPSLVTNELTGQPALRFDGVDDFLEGVSDFDISGSDFTMIVVHQRTGGHKKAAPLSYSSEQSAKGAPLLRWGPAQDQIGIDSVGIGSNEDGVFVDVGNDFETRTYISYISRSGGDGYGLNANLELRVFGSLQTAEASGIQTWTSEPTSGYFVGKRRPNSNHYLEGDVLEILVYNAALSAEQITTVEGWLNGKYGIVVDYDNDSLADSWEFEHFGDLSSNPLEDADGDGLVNLQESNLGTDPLAATEAEGILAMDGLKLWFDAEQGVELDENGFVSGWKDASGYGHSAWQVFPENRPTVATNTVNGRPAIHFAGQGKHLEGDSRYFNPSASDYTIVAVHKRGLTDEKGAVASFRTVGEQDGAPNLKWKGDKKLGINKNGADVDGDDSNSVFVNVTTDSRERFFISSIRRTDDHNTEGVIVGENGEGSLLKVRHFSEAGFYEEEGIQSWVSNPTDGFFIGKNRKNISLDKHLVGEIAEILVFDRSLNEDTLSELEDLLIEKYDIDHDYDNDGFWNFDEDSNQNGVVDAGETDPRNEDTDGNGIADPYDWHVPDAFGPQSSAFVSTLSNDAEGHVHFFHGFENSENFSKDPLHGQNGWEASQTDSESVKVSGKDGFESNRSVRLEGYNDHFPGRVHATMHFDGDDLAAHDQIWITIHAKLKPGHLPSAETISGPTAGFFALDFYGALSVFDASRGEAGQWVRTNRRIDFEEDNWHRYDTHLDYSTQTWSLYLNGLPAITNIPFQDSELTYFSRLRILHGAKTDELPAYVDSIAVSSEEPASELDFDEDGLTNDFERSIGLNVESQDTDGDGMSDFFEVSYGLNGADPSDMHGDLDGDGLANIMEFRHDLDPTNPDTDGDGLDDTKGARGVVLREAWNNINTNQHLVNFLEHRRFPHSPYEVTYPTTVETPYNWLKYSGQRLRGYIEAPQSGDYTFWVAGRFSFELWLSSDERKFNKRRIAYGNTQLAQYQFDELDSQKSEPVYLEAGQRYYFEVLLFNRGGRNHVEVAWQIPGATREILGGDNIIAYRFDVDDQDDDEMPDSWEIANGLSPYDDGNIDWNQGAKGDPDGDGVINELELAADLSGQYENFDNDSYTDFLEYYLELDPESNDNSRVEIGLPEPWQARDYEGDSQFFTVDEAPCIVALGDRWNRNRSGALGYLNVSDDFEMVVQPVFPRYARREALAGIMARLSPGSGAKSFHILTSKSSTWLKMVRRGSTVTTYTSVDGETWLLKETSNFSEQQNWYVGFVLNSKSPSLYGGVRFENVSISLDSDKDGLYDPDELILGTDPDVADSDADGISDYEEVHLAFTDPLVNQFIGISNDSLVILGDQYSSVFGEWISHPNRSVEAGALHGELEYVTEIPAEGVYRILLNSSVVESLGDNLLKLEVEIDGTSLGKREVTTDGSANYEFAFYSQVLTPGPHEIIVRWQNHEPDLRLVIHHLKIQRFIGTDLDSNQIDDWVEMRLSDSYELDTHLVESFVSPFCFEGEGRHIDLIDLVSALQDGSVREEALQTSTRGRWYSDIELDESSPITITASSENNYWSDSATVEWKSFNLMEQDTIVIRVGDRLKLVAEVENCSDCESPANVSLLNANDLTPLDSFSIDGGDFRIYGFPISGNYILRAQKDGALQDVYVSVEDFAYNESIRVGLGKIRDWDPGYISHEIELETDSFVWLNQLPSGKFDLSIDDSDTGHIVVRLENSRSILTVIDVIPVEFTGASGTSYEFVETLPDGSTVLEMGVFLGELSEDLSMKIEIFVGGVVFDDGTTVKILTADNFDEYGYTTVRFVRGPGITTSTCHRLLLYQGDVFIGN